VSIASDLVCIATDLAKRMALPPLRHVYIPELGPTGKKAVFGLLALDDDSTGFFYMRLGDTIEQLKAAVDPRQLIGRRAEELATWFDSQNDPRKPLGLGAINAISQHLFRLSGYRLEATTNSMGALAFTPTDHVGMVGFFPSLINRLRRQNIPVTVLEKKPELVCTETDYTVTLDPSALDVCTHVLCTAATLLNDTLDDLLTHCRSAEHIAVIGPSAGCLPDPLFARGVTIVGGSAVNVFSTLLERVRQQRPWGDAVAKYSIRKADYPGFAALQERL
jgi:uncharacterized protein (DUF4213/DUF364 family)